MRFEHPGMCYGLGDSTEFARWMSVYQGYTGAVKKHSSSDAYLDYPLGGCPFSHF